MKQLLFVMGLGAMVFLFNAMAVADDDKAAEKLKAIEKNMKKTGANVKSEDELKKFIEETKPEVEKLIPDLKDDNLKEAYSLLINMSRFLAQNEDVLKYCDAILKLKLSDDQHFIFEGMKFYTLKELGKKDEADKLLDKLFDEYKGDKKKTADLKVAKAQELVKEDKIDDAKKLFKEALDGMDDEEKKYAQSDLRNLELIGTAPKDFKETAVDGGDFSLANYKGKWVLLDFWATWCGPCRAELPNVKELYGKYKDKGFAILGISLDQDKSKLKEFIAKEKIEWPQYFDNNGSKNKLAALYNVEAIPLTVLINPDGKIYRIGLRGKELKKTLAEQLDKK